MTYMTNTAEALTINTDLAAEVACGAFLARWKTDRAAGIFHNNNCHGDAFIAAKGDRNIADEGVRRAKAMIAVLQG